jgi:hypothetical protein
MSKSLVGRHKSEPYQLRVMSAPTLELKRLVS